MWAPLAIWQPSIPGGFDRPEHAQRGQQPGTSLQLLLPRTCSAAVRGLYGQVTHN